MKLRFTSEPKEGWFELCISDESKVIFQDLQQQQQPISAAAPPRAAAALPLSCRTQEGIKKREKDMCGLVTPVRNQGHGVALFRLLCQTLPPSGVWNPRSVVSCLKKINLGVCVRDA